MDKKEETPKEAPETTQATAEASEKADLGADSPKIKNQADHFKGTVNCTRDQLWEIYVNIENPVTIPKMMDVLAQRNVTCSDEWVRIQIKKWGFEPKKRFMFATLADPSKFNEKQVRDYLITIGNEVNMLDMLKGLQTRILSVVAQQLPVREDPQYFKGMAEFYKMVTDEAMRTYQHKIANGEDMPMALQPKPELQEKITPFKKRG